MRSMQKAIEQYNELAARRSAEFYCSDIYQILKSGNDPVDWITNALMAGYAIGYRQCKQQKHPHSCGRTAGA